MSPDDQARFRALESRCAAIVGQQQGQDASAAVVAQGQGLGRLLWIYLRLLLTRHNIQQILREVSGQDRALADRVTDIESRLKTAALSDQLRKSLVGQSEILQQRLSGQVQAREKLAFLDAEMTRIEQQAELIREQAVLTADPQVVSDRIDQVAATLGDTTQWIREQQQLYGQVEDLLTEPPPMALSQAQEKV
jgi:hypothetical protein